MAQTNNINKTSFGITIDPQSSGDSFIQFSINETSKFRIGVDDSDSDKFKISSGGSLGTNDCFTVFSSGEVTKPLQPAFLATIDNTSASATGDGTLFSVPFAIEYIDKNSDFTSSVFTAPVSGKFRFACGVMPTALSSSHTSIELYLVTSNRTFVSYICNPYAIGTTVGSTYQSSRYLSVLCDMDASDTAEVKVKISGGAKTAGIGYDNRGYFCGSLVC